MPQHRTHGRGCPSRFEVACSEAGGLGRQRRAAVLAHAGHCARCRTWLAEVDQARAELLGMTDEDRLSHARRAARLISGLLRERLH